MYHVTNALVQLKALCKEFNLEASAFSTETSKDQIGELLYNTQLSLIKIYDIMYSMPIQFIEESEEVAKWMNDCKNDIENNRAAMESMMSNGWPRNRIRALFMTLQDSLHIVTMLPYKWKHCGHIEFEYNSSDYKFSQESIELAM